MKKAELKQIIKEVLNEKIQTTKFQNLEKELLKIGFKKVPSRENPIGDIYGDVKSYSLYKIVSDVDIYETDDGYIKIRWGTKDEPIEDEFIEDFNIMDLKHNIKSKFKN